MRARRMGFSLIELLIVMTIMGIMGMYAYPKMRGTTASWSTRSARQQVTSMIIVARAAAVQNGSEARFIRSGNVARVTVDSNGTYVTLASRDLYRDHGVTFTTGGTARAKVQLVEELGGVVAGVLFVIELDFLHGRDRLAGYDVHSLIQY